MRHYAFRFLLGGSTIVRHPLARKRNSARFLAVSSACRAAHFLHLHFFLHAEGCSFRNSPLNFLIFNKILRTAHLWRYKSFFNDSFSENEPNNCARSNSKDNGKNAHTRNFLRTGIRQVRIAVIYGWQLAAVVIAVVC